MEVIKNSVFNVEDVFVDWTRYNQIADNRKKYVITFAEFKYVNTEDVDEVQELVSTTVKEGDVLIRSITGDWKFFTREQFEKSFQNLI